jgi:hypothetical protein
MGITIDLDQGCRNQLAYKERMVVSRFIGMAMAILMVVVSMNVGAMAGMSDYAPQQHHSTSVQPEHDAAARAGGHGMIDQDCCLGSFCVSAGVLAEAVKFVNPHQLADMPALGINDTLSGRLIAPETGPPKRLA